MNLPTEEASNTPNLKSILVTGGAGFIGSNLVEELLQDQRVDKVRVLDNLSNGFMRNIDEFMSHPKFEFIEGDIRDYQTCLDACDGMNLVSHQAALGSVPRSIKDPITTDQVNIGGTLNMFHAVKETQIERIVFAASSSTYGDSGILPKIEDEIGKPLSPYAITKYVNELYADVFARTYSNFEYIGLRYFNVFGPKQDPNGAYAAVIPLFMKAIRLGKSATINGDGSYSRDFTYVSNAVQANLLSLFTTRATAINEIYNVAFGEQTTLNELWSMICDVKGRKIEPTYGPIRQGDIPHSQASIEKAKKYLDYNPKIDTFRGLKLLAEKY
ncbi:MAG: SDR family oxidoreductase [Bacteroidota bacterium]